MTKIAINRCFGGFGISNEATELYLTKKNLNWKKVKSTLKYSDDHYQVDGEYYSPELERDDPILIEVIEELGDKANDRFAKIEIVEIPDDVTDWFIDDYDGQESIHESHRSW